MVSVHVEELYHAQNFGQVDRPIRRIVISVVEGAARVASLTRRVAVFRAGLAMQTAGIEKLDQTEQFRKRDPGVLVWVGGMEGMLFAAHRDVRFFGSGVVKVARGNGQGNGVDPSRGIRVAWIPLRARCAVAEIPIP